MKRIISFLLIAVLVFLTSCTDRVTGSSTASISPVGTDSTIEIINWNVLFSGSTYFTSTKEAQLAAIINDLDADIYALQEFPSAAQLNRLLELTPDYDGIFTPDPGNYNQDLAYLYRRDLVVVSSADAIYPYDTYAFPRAPFVADFSCNNTYGSFSVHLINVHLKASSGESNDTRRRIANDSLLAYCDRLKAETPDKSIIILGDFNDTLNDSVVYGAWYSAVDRYWFATEPLHENDFYATYPSFPSFIDHQLLSADLYNGGGPLVEEKTTTLRIDDQLSTYGQYFDHRPVMTVYYLR